MKIPLLDEAYETMRKDVPELVGIFSPRRYIPPAGYFNPRGYAPLAAAICGAPVANRNHAKEMTDCRINAYNLARLEVPTYFITHEFGAAVMATNPPEGFTVGDIKWPLEAMLFMIPESLQKSIWGRVVPFITISKLHAGVQTPPENLMKVIPGLRSITYERGEVGGSVLHGLVMLGDQPMDYSGACSDSRLLTDVIKDAKFVDETYSDPLTNAMAERAHLTKDDDADIITKLNKFAYGVLLAMSARPELVEAGGIERHQKIRRGVVTQEALWHANLIGRHYKVVRSEPTGEHNSPRMHWRRGHFRNQAHGEKHALRRMTWIEPMLVGAEVEV